MIEALTWKRPYRKESHSHEGGYVIREYRCPYDPEEPIHYHALYKRKAPDGGVMLDFVVLHKRFKTYKAAEDACNTHWRKKCHSMNTSVTPAGTKQKNSNKPAQARKPRVSVQSALKLETSPALSDT